VIDKIPNSFDFTQQFFYFNDAGVEFFAEALCI